MTTANDLERADNDESLILICAGCNRERVIYNLWSRKCAACDDADYDAAEDDYARRLQAAEDEYRIAHAHDTYTVAVETGSCCGPHDAHNPAPAGGCSWEERATCGHHHRTYAAAERCRDKLLNWDRDGRNCSALWYNSKIHNQHGQRV